MRNLSIFCEFPRQKVLKKLEYMIFYKIKRRQEKVKHIYFGIHFSNNTLLTGAQAQPHNINAVIKFQRNLLFLKWIGLDSY